ncbi:MAG: OmpA family protein [Myxococcota bacterium]
MEDVHRTRMRIRSWRRSAEPTLGLWPWAVLPLLLLGLLFAYALTVFAEDIETEVRERTEAMLRERGLDGVEVAVEGQEVTLSGSLPADVTDAAMLRRARSVPGSTFLDGLVTLPAPTVVRGRFTAGAREPEVAEPEGSLDLEASFEAGLLEVRGVVADEATRDAVLQRARRVAAARVLPAGAAPIVIEDGMRVGDVGAPSWASQALAGRLFEALVHCLEGAGQTEGGVLTLDPCYAEPEDAEALEARLREGLDPASLGVVRVVRVEGVRACEERIAELLAQERIRFEVSSAELSPESEALIDRVAEVVGECPGTVRIEGHTDRTGNAATNETLSMDRALAVRDALVAREIEASRLVPRGFGPRRPRALGDAEADHAANRRIEFHVTWHEDAAPAGED